MPRSKKAVQQLSEAVQNQGSVVALGGAKMQFELVNIKNEAVKMLSTQDNDEMEQYLEEKEVGSVVIGKLTEGMPTWNTRQGGTYLLTAASDYFFHQIYQVLPDGTHLIPRKIVDGIGQNAGYHPNPASPNGWDAVDYMGGKPIVRGPYNVTVKGQRDENNVPLRILTSTVHDRAAAKHTTIDVLRSPEFKGVRIFFPTFHRKLLATYLCQWGCDDSDWALEDRDVRIDNRITTRRLYVERGKQFTEKLNREASGEPEAPPSKETVERVFLVETLDQGKVNLFEYPAGEIKLYRNNRYSTKLLWTPDVDVDATVTNFKMYLDRGYVVGLELTQ